MPLIFGAQGVQPTLRGQPSNNEALQAGEVRLVPAGAWLAKMGPYSNYQVFDPITGIWRNVGDGGITAYIQSDGVNHRIANQGGCTVGALITNGGTGYTSAPTVTATGGSVWQAIIGGAVNTSVTVTNTGANYVYPPEVAFDAPPSPGMQATGFATISAGAITSITVTNQGAGYANRPHVSLINDPRDSTGYGGAASAVLTGAGTVTGLLCTDHGNPQTSVPTLTFSGGGGSAGAATAIMCWSITGYTASGGAGYTSGAGAVEITAIPQLTAGNPTLTNPNFDVRLVRMRQAIIYAPTINTGAITATGAVVIDGGIYQNVPTSILVINAGFYPSQSTLALTMGGLTDFCQLYPV